MKYILIVFCALMTHAYGQVDTIFTDDFRITIEELFSELDENSYEGKLIERSLSNSQVVFQQTLGNYNQTHNAGSWLEVYQAIFDSYIDTSEMLSKSEIVNEIFKFYGWEEYNNDEELAIVPFSLVIHKLNALDTLKILNGDITYSNGALVSTIDEDELYRPILLKSASILEFYGDNGYDLGQIKYNSNFISTSDEIEVNTIRINVGNGFEDFGPNNAIIEYPRLQDSVIAYAEINYYLDNQLNIDTIPFYLTGDLGKTKLINTKSVDRWDEVIDDVIAGESMKFEVGIKYGCGNNNKIRRPIIIAPPYRPVIQSFSMDKYYDQFDFKSLISSLSEMGYDVLFIKEKPGNNRVERAGRLLAEYILKINIEKKVNYPNEDWENILMGFSAGGLHARYALMYLEKRHMDYGTGHHHTRLYIPFDSPHLGANIPMFTQVTYYEMKSQLNILALIAYEVLIDEGSKDMAVNHILSSNLHNSSGKFWDMAVQPTTERVTLMNTFEISFNHSYTNIGDLRKAFPSFTRNVAVSAGSYFKNYTQNYFFDPGEKLFAQESYFLPTAFGYEHKIRKLYASKYGQEQTLLDLRDVNVILGIIPIERNRVYRTSNLYEFDMAQGGYKNDLYDGPLTGAIQMLQSGFSFGIGQKFYEGNISFIPVVSALAINPTIWQNNNLYYNTQDQGLMYNKFNYNPITDKSDTYGYPNLGHPTNHFNITPFEAVYTDPYNYEHIKMQKSVTAGNYDDSYLVYTRNFILDEVEADIVCLQNKVIGQNHNNWIPNYRYKAWYKAEKTIKIGYNVTPKTDLGEYVIESSGDIVTYAGESIEVAPAWASLHVKQGATWHAYIANDYCSRPKMIMDDSGEEQNENVQNGNEQRIVLNNATLNNSEESMIIYPNPNSGIFTIHFPDEQTEGQILLKNISGITLNSYRVSSSTMEIRKSDLTSGIYFVTWIRNGVSAQTLKIIVQ